MPTLNDVAHEAGVSIATASMVLNPGKGGCRVRPERAERVREAALRLGYVANYHARAMQMGRAETLGLALDFGNPGVSEPPSNPMGGAYFHQLTAGVEAQTHFVGHNLAIIGPGKEERSVDRAVRQIQQRRLDALVVAATLHSVRASRTIAEQPMLPVVLVEHNDKSEFPIITYDEAEGVARAVRHLAGLGHRELLWLGPEDSTPRAREPLFNRSVKDAGLRGGSCRFEPQPPAHGRDMLAESAQAALTRRLTEPRNFTGVIAYNDSVGIGALAALLTAGLHVPRDVSVVGFDDIQAVHAYPRLTTVSHLLFEMGKRAAELALEMAADAEAIARLRGHREALVPELVIRDSTGPAPKKV